MHWVAYIIMIVADVLVPISGYQQPPCWLLCQRNQLLIKILLKLLTLWSRVMHICLGNIIIIGSDNGPSPRQCQAIIWTNAGILLIGPLGTNFSEISIEILTFSFQKMHLKASSVKWRPFCLGRNVLNYVWRMMGIIQLSGGHLNKKML